MKHYFKLLRPKQWLKNLFVLAPMVFAFKFTDPTAWHNVLIAIGCFILISSTTYIVNDVRDAEEDRSHPRKKKRPIADRKISVPAALLFAAILLGSAVWLLFMLPTACFYVMIAYLLLQLAYTHGLKRQAILDVLIIASGFVLRVLMGGYAINVPISPWIILTTFLLAMFLGFGKRYHELSVEGYGNVRHSLQRYSAPLLDRLIGISCVATLISYALYTVETARATNKTELVYTVVFVIFGLFRYLQVLYIDKQGGEPERALLRDPVFLVNGLAWFGVTLWMLMR